MYESENRQSQNQYEYHHPHHLLGERKNRRGTSPDPTELRERGSQQHRLGPRADALRRARESKRNLEQQYHQRHRQRPPLHGGSHREEEPSEVRDQVFNSFTSSYHRHTGTPTSSAMPARRTLAAVPPPTGTAASPEGADPPSVASKSRRGMSTPRRVIFSEQLEIHDRKKAQPPPTPTIPILRERIVTKNNTSRTAIASTMKPKNAGETRYSARDPTPRSSEKKFRQTGRRKTIAEILEEQDQKKEAREPTHNLSSDPPLSQSPIPLFSPAATKSPRNLFSKMELRARAADANAAQNRKHSQRLARSIHYDVKKSMEPEEQTKPYSTMSILSSLAQQEWDMSSIFPDFSQKQEEPKSPGASRLYTASYSEARQPVKIKAYQPRSDHWDAPDVLPDSWRALVPTLSPANTNETREVPSTGKGSRATSKRKKVSKHRKKQQVAGDISKQPESKSPVHLSSDQPLSHEEGRKTDVLPNYFEIEEDTTSNQGTEVVLIPTQDKKTEIQSETSTSKKEKVPSWGKLLLGAASSPSNSSSQGLPIVTMPFDDDVEAKGTDDTSQTDDSGFDKTKWDMFEEDSQLGDDDDDYLIPRKTRKFPKFRKKGCMLVSMLVLALTISVVSIFFLLSQSSDPSSKEPSELCVSFDADSGRFSERYAALRKIMLAQSQGETEMVDEPESAQRKALCWLADGDEQKITVDATTIPSLIQRYTLAVLYYSWVIEGWTESQGLINTNFLSASHECDWDVVLCGAPDTVTALLLSDKALRGPLPEEIGNLESLSFLELSLNKLTGVLPTTLGRLTLLDYFAVAFNQLSGSLPAEMGSLTKLEFMNMRSSQVRGTVPSELGQLTNIHTMLLEGNWLSGTIPPSLGRLVEAQQMSFRKNYFTGKVSSELCELRDISLTELKVDSWIDCDCCTV